ncbi:mandelate racemase/muconate lactonizing enzyme family protein [Paenibacillus solisilvae]|uniref:Mandelate racemase/muconate lactonizing enzyme family protein n=1 Tax=Paenibacillus solisilvae TaxID=2486751 RepID=A0ABW0VY28_9BACL
MRIANITAIPIKVPRERPFRTTFGVSQYSQYGIVIVDTDEGIQGVGEISFIWSGNGHSMCHEIESIFKPLLVGENPFNLTRCIQILEKAYPWSRKIFAAIAALDMALHDIVGKALNTPVYNLLGGKVRDEVNLSVSIPIDEPEVMAQTALEYKDQGFKAVKVKVGIHLEKEIEAIGRIRKACGDDFIIRVDANMGWKTSKEAIQAIRKMEPYHIHSVEQPLPYDMTEETAYIRERVDVPIMIDESVWSIYDAINTVRHCADYLNVYTSESGGLYRAMQIFHIAEAARRSCFIGSMPELGVGTAANLHLAVSVPQLGEPSDVCGYLYHQDDIIMEKFEFKDGKIRPFDQPGLGIHLDMDKINKYKV